VKPLLLPKQKAYAHVACKKAKVLPFRGANKRP